MQPRSHDLPRPHLVARVKRRVKKQEFPYVIYIDSIMSEDPSQQFRFVYQDSPVAMPQEGKVAGSSED
jgi:hypothetical protein